MCIRDRVCRCLLSPRPKDGGRGGAARRGRRRGTTRARNLPPPALAGHLPHSVGEEKTPFSSPPQKWGRSRGGVLRRCSLPEGPPAALERRVLPLRKGTKR